jgi:hypothetical protein
MNTYSAVTELLHTYRRKDETILNVTLEVS